MKLLSICTFLFLCVTFVNCSNSSDEDENEVSDTEDIIENNDFKFLTHKTETCNNICDSQNSVRSRNNREQSDMSTSNIIEKRTRASKK